LALAKLRMKDETDQSGRVAIVSGFYTQIDPTVCAFLASYAGDARAVEASP
jgi:hypothetical protein